MTREFNVVIERDEDGIYIASMPGLQGCHTQAESLDELNVRIKEAIELYLEVKPEEKDEKYPDFVELQKVKIGIK